MPIAAPADLRELQERYFLAKRCYEEIIANR